jgi:hypothetical protein
LKYGIKWITYKGKEILYLDIGVTKSNEDVKELLEEVVKIIQSRPKDSILYLTNMDGAYISAIAMQYYKDAGIEAAESVKAWAAFGLNNLKVLLLSELRRKYGITAQEFTSIDEAKNWLIIPE